MFWGGHPLPQLIKLNGKPDNAGPDWYGPAKVIETVPTPVTGEPDEAHICTSPWSATTSTSECTATVHVVGKCVQ